MALHTVALAKKVLLDFFQKIAGLAFIKPKAGRALGRLPQQAKPPSQKRARELEDPPEGSSNGAKLHNTTEQNCSPLRTTQ